MDQGRLSVPPQGAEQPRGAPPAASRASGASAARRHRDWAWRRKIRQDPARYRVYRAVVAVVGGFLLLLSAATGWLPGPGGIPLALLGLAVLASEFTWAHRMLERAKAWARGAAERASRRPRWLQWLITAVVVAGIVGGVWLWLWMFGLPGWLPEQATAVLVSVPGLG